jgi:hypothetical protein
MNIERRDEAREKTDEIEKERSSDEKKGTRETG